MSDFNKVFLSGRLARDPELKYTSSGSPYVKFDLAVDRRVKQGDDWTSVPTFINRITLWDKQAENLQRYARQGDQLFIEGYLSVDEWEQDGQKRRVLQVTCTAYRLGAKKGGGGGGGGYSGGGDDYDAPQHEPAAPQRPAPKKKDAPAPRNYEPPSNIEDDDIPF